MKWSEKFPKDSQPDLAQIGDYTVNPLWQELRGHLETTYGVVPTIEHSVCGGAPGWNVKYKKSGRALCTLYPADGFFTCLVSIGSKEAMEAELIVPACTDYVRELYRSCKPFNGSRWLMIDVKSPDILADAISLIGTRAKPQKPPRQTCEAEKSVKDVTDLDALIAGIQSRDTTAAYACFLQLLQRSREAADVYRYFELFARMMGSTSAYERTRGLLLIAANARWDTNFKIDELIDEYLAHVTDAKPTVARQLIAALPELARYKPELAPDIIRALKNADPGRYRDSMVDLVQKDIASALEQIT